jgi:hypothetical protein
MKVRELFLTEITKLAKHDYLGGSLDMEAAPKGTKWKPLPGGSDLVWGTARFGKRIEIYIQNAGGAEKEQVLGCLKLSKFDAPQKGDLKDAYQVDTISVLEDARKRGVGKSLYGIALTVLKLTLVAGTGQTPAGRKAWLGLASTPGAEVKGLVMIQDSKHMPDADKVMELGGQYLGTYNGALGKEHFFAFDVVEGKNELAPAIKNELSDIYKKFWTTMYAKWRG